MLNFLKHGRMAGAMLGAALLAGAASATELRYAHVGAEGDIQTVYAAQAAEGIAAATGGEITVTVYPASQLGGVAEMVDGVRMGSISMGHHDFASLARLVPEVAVFNAPFIYRDGAHALAATDPQTSPALQAINEKLVAQGVRIIGRIYRGDRHISSNFPVKTPADLAGKPFRAVPLELWVSMVKGFGAIPTPVEVAELPTALMTGVVVGQENPLTMIASNNLNEVQSHLSMTGHMRAVLAVFINEDVWQGLSEEQRSALTKVLDEEARTSLKMATESEADLVKELKGRGMTVITEAEGLDVAAFREKVSAQIRQDFPDFAPLIEQIEAVK
ncbi:TRAP transporter substrate-binding protein [Sinorhizobium medicae]|uniref:TRAP transporter substrate-binding protein n=1 Tax=Sinorhizobium medicae TaxID=110321 RepID=UPI000FDA57A0|nr:TRAP transporter substrate-binding protein [Sinorhizobium medicae]MDX0492430.1 TRAP transporter substrate-binding protein [Sinorhizobium medicae]MDX0541858.1 TRAP transporter substrate-binding protein [Sinorhizobium medicae]MDX0997913.1 TRAP transporter substrate-binding protein [Sinorhizobium medicae]MDX1039715.1 TRAP transporter substrate-binding protein [Sinorhizobium medicae]MDX1181722.1 TRAP transporter substrate-binding protein [Sinorhizobium medicae]